MNASGKSYGASGNSRFDGNITCQHHSRRTDRKRVLTPGQVRFQLERIQESRWMSALREKK